MAATIAKATGHDKTRVKETHRLGSVSAEAEAATYRTFAFCSVRRDGSGCIRVTRDGEILHHFDFGPENEV